MLNERKEHAKRGGYRRRRGGGKSEVIYFRHGSPPHKMAAVRDRSGRMVLEGGGMGRIELEYGMKRTKSGMLHLVLWSMDVILGRVNYYCHC